MTMRDIAKKLGISVATVSRALSDSENINEETKRKIQEYAAGLSYVPNAVARNLSKKRNKGIAIIVPNISNAYFALLIEEISNYFYSKNYSIVLYNTNEIENIEKDAIKDILENRLEAVIAIPIKSNYENNPYASIKSVPLILLDREIDNFESCGVYIDDFNGAYDITRKLLESGHENIAYISGNLELNTALKRLEGYKKAYKDLKIKINKKNIYMGNFDFKSGEQIGKELLKNEEITAIFSSNNLMFLGILKILKEKREKYKLACFDRIDVLDILEYDFITLDLDFKNLGEEIYIMTKFEEKKKIYIKPTLVGGK